MIEMETVGLYVASIRVLRCSVKVRTPVKHSYSAKSPLCICMAVFPPRTLVARVSVARATFQTFWPKRTDAKAFLGVIIRYSNVLEEFTCRKS